MDITKLDDNQLKQLWYQELGKKEEAIVQLSQAVSNMAIIDTEIQKRRATGSPLPDENAPVADAMKKK